MAKSGTRGSKKNVSYTSRRPRPSAPRAGFKANGSRYGSGGRVKKQKSS